MFACADLGSDLAESRAAAALQRLNASSASASGPGSSVGAGGRRNSVASIHARQSSRAKQEVWLASPAHSNACADFVCASQLVQQQAALEAAAAAQTKDPEDIEMDQFIEILVRIAHKRYPGGQERLMMQSELANDRKELAWRLSNARDSQNSAGEHRCRLAPC